MNTTLAKENPQFIASASDRAQISLSGQFSATVVEIVGTIATGYVAIHGNMRVGGSEPLLFTENVNGGGQASFNDVANHIGAAGIYRVASAGMNTVYVTPSDDFASTDGIQVFMWASESLPPLAVIGL